MNRHYFITFLLLILIYPSTASAEYAMTAAQVKLLPDFCRYLSIANFQDDAKHLKRQGKLPGQHGQHYCHGLKSLNIGLYKSSKGALQTAVKEFEYVQLHSNSKNPLLPGTSLNKAKAYEYLGETQSALREYQHAIKLKPNYSKAYMALSDLYFKLGMKDQAYNTIKTGLKYSKSSKGLNRRLKKMEGDTTTTKGETPTEPSKDN